MAAFPPERRDERREEVDGGGWVIDRMNDIRLPSRARVPVSQSMKAETDDCVMLLELDG